MNRRLFLKLLLSLPILGSLGLFASPLFRYLRPTSGPLASTKLDTSSKDWKQWQGTGGLFSQPDMPKPEEIIEFDLSAFPGPWSYKEFTFKEQSREYTFSQFQATKIPGFIVRLPEDKDGKPDFSIVSRICPHMGCVFNYLTDPAEVATGYNYAKATNPMYACPCHLSVYDPLQLQASGGPEGDIRGKVVSGPAPRPPRIFHFDVDTGRNKLVITSKEQGGIS